MNNKIWLIVGIVFTFMVGVTPALGFLNEVKTECGLFDCYTILNTDFNIPASYIGKTFNSEQLPETYKHEHIGKIENLKIEVLSKNQIKVTGKIGGSTKNLWGLTLLGDTSFKDSTWWNSSYNASLCLSIDHNNVTGTFSNFTIMINLTSARINYTRTQDNGQDIVVINDSCNDTGSIRPFEIEKWNESGDSIIWANIDNVDNTTDRNFSIYFWNTTPVPNYENVPDTWDDNYIIVHHQRNYTDSKYHNNRTAGTATLNSYMIDGNYFYNAGSSNYMCLGGDIGYLFAGDPFTQEIFVTMTDNVTAKLWAYESDGGWGLMLGHDQSAGYYCNMYNGVSSTVTMGATIGDKYYIVCENEGTALDYNGYLNGALVGSVVSNGWSQNHGGKLSAYMIGAMNTNNCGLYSPALYATAQIDEVRISTDSRGYEYIATEYQNLIDKLVIYGAEIEQPVTTTTTTTLEANGTSFDVRIPEDNLIQMSWLIALAIFIIACLGVLL